MNFLPCFSLETWILLITFVCLVVMYGRWTFGVFEKMGVPGPKPILYWGTLSRHNSVYYLADVECAQKYGRVWGMYEFRTPILSVMDPDMLKTILVKECFTYFTNRRNLHLNGELYDAVAMAEDEQWRRIRHILSPSFTSGRLREMFTIMKSHSRKLTDSLQPKAENNEVVSVKDFFGPYSMDVMASCVCSVDLDTIKNPSNPFYTHAVKMFKIPMALYIFQACFPIFLPLLERLGVSLFSKSSIAFFKMFVEKIRAGRNRSTFQNSCDMLQLMMNSQAENGTSRGKQNNGLTDHELISQVTMFVFAGFETTEITLNFLAYNLARNPEVMERLQTEIDATFPNKGPVQYEALLEMEYLDCVINESLRLYPPIARADRVAKETVQINEITIPKDMVVFVPIYALHHDPELWPEPEEFNPERFNKDNKKSINPYTYLPFGSGPRNCMGMRFALMVVKLALVEVLQRYSFSVCLETEYPLKMDPEGMVRPINPIKLKMMTR
ncbi:cytochrome P450 3A27-like [Pholidichthys leucotaenia]